jgi:apolipoprotein N-acyltransferase
VLRLHALVASISSMGGWRRAGIAFVSGAASALAHAPVHAWPILFLTVPLLVWLIDGAPQQFWQKLKASAAIGWCFGFGYFLVGLYWISNALMVDLSTFGWLLPIAVPAVPAGLAVFMAIGVDKGSATIGSIVERSKSKVAMYSAPGSAFTARARTASASSPRCLTR